MIGVGRRMQMENRHHCGQIFQKLPSNAELNKGNIVLDTLNAARLI